MKFRLRVLHVFKFGEQTLLVTEQDKSLANLSGALCQLEVDGKNCEALLIDVDSSTGKDHRDLWFRSNLTLAAHSVLKGTAWLVSSN